MTPNLHGPYRERMGPNDLQQRIRALEERCADLAEQLKAKDQQLEHALEGQYAAYRQLVELERVRAFDEIARGIEHALYNALTPVEGYTELMLMDPRPLGEAHRAKEYLETILAASRDARSAIPRLRELYYSTGALDFDQHQSVSEVLSKALTDAAAEALEEVKANPAAQAAFDTETLSPREWDVLRLLSDGLKNREIADLLNVSENTVKTHIRAILSKLSLKNRTQAAAYALLDQHAFDETRKVIT
jgi:ATP/maltotriose-dependent transcriptional regulator MalT